MQPDCENCLLLQAQKMLRKYNFSCWKSNNIIDRFNRFMNQNRNNGLLTPEAACFLHRLIKKETNTDDLYKKEKRGIQSVNVEP